MQYKMADDNITQEDMDLLADWLHTGPWLTQNGYVSLFEQRWSEWMNGDPTRGYSAFVNSGSSANLIMFQVLKNLGIAPKVVVPAVGWPTTIMPALQLGFDPLVCDADIRTFGLDVSHLEYLCENEKPQVVILVHVLGVPCNMDEIMRLKEKYGFYLLEDCCGAHGSEYKGRKVGTFGEMASFSFFYGHAMTTIEGGMVFTNSINLYDHLLMARSHGWSKDLDHSKRAELEHEHDPDSFAARFTFYEDAFNVRSTDLNAKLGVHQLERLDEAVAARAYNHTLYRALLSQDSRFIVQDTVGTETASISFAALAESTEHRRIIGKRLARAQIEARPLGGGNMTRQPFWKRHHDSVALPVADQIHDRAFHVPNHPGLSHEDVEFIAATVIGE